MSSEQIVAYCVSAGIGSETMAQVSLSDGSVVTGIVDCRAEGVAPPTDEGDQQNISDSQANDQNDANQSQSDESAGGQSGVDGAS